MSAFAIVSRIDYLPRLLADLAGLRQMHRLRTGPGHLALNGIWVEPWAGTNPGIDGSLRDRLASGVLRVVIPLELSGIWALCRPEAPDVSRASLLGAIADAARGSADAREGRFIPVFHHHEPLHHRQAEWAALDARHPGIVLPPLQQSASGVIAFVAPGDVGEPTRQREANSDTCATDGPRHRAPGGAAHA